MESSDVYGLPFIQIYEERPDCALHGFDDDFHSWGDCRRCDFKGIEIEDCVEDSVRYGSSCTNQHANTVECRSYE